MLFLVQLVDRIGGELRFVHIAQSPLAFGTCEDGDSSLWWLSEDGGTSEQYQSKVLGYSHRLSAHVGIQQWRSEGKWCSARQKKELVHTSLHTCSESLSRRWVISDDKQLAGLDRAFLIVCLFVFNLSLISFRSSLNRAMDLNICYVYRSWRITRNFCGRRPVFFVFYRSVHRSKQRWSLKTPFKRWRNNCITRLVYACNRTVCRSFGISPIKPWNSFVFVAGHRRSMVDCLFS